MAGSYNHTVNEQGQLLNSTRMTIATETGGDAYETIEEMYGMIWWLAGGQVEQVELARQRWREGVELSPGRESE